MSQALTDLISLLTLECSGEHRFIGKGSTGDGAAATYGGHFLGQAISAALHDSDATFMLHSMHGYFLRGGVPNQPIVYDVQTIREGRSFCTKRVIASQENKINFELLASFNKKESGKNFESIATTDLSHITLPENIEPYRDIMAKLDPLPLPEEWALREHGIDVRIVNAPWASGGLSQQGGINMWIKTNGLAPPAPKLHAAMLAYQSDESIADNVLLPFNLTWGSPDLFFVSLDHALWLHSPIDLNEWHFVEQKPITVQNNRGLAAAKVWSPSGLLVASFTQEVLMRESP